MNREAPSLERFIGSLGVGRDQAERGRNLCFRLACTDRHLRALAHEADSRGILVCADNAGYYIPASQDEVRETVRRLLSQAHEMIERAHRLDDLAAARWAEPGTRGTQGSLWDRRGDGVQP